VFAVALACWLAENWIGPYTGLMVHNTWAQPGEINPPQDKYEALEDLGRGLDWDWEDNYRNPWSR
jgi:hypothetical protein